MTHSSRREIGDEHEKDSLFRYLTVFAVTVWSVVL
jgi:hypothetical protein